VTTDVEERKCMIQWVRARLRRGGRVSVSLARRNHIRPRTWSRLCQVFRAKRKRQ
jgi:hypothetical protein